MTFFSNSALFQNSIRDSIAQGQEKDKSPCESINEFINPFGSSVDCQDDNGSTGGQQNQQNQQSECDASIMSCPDSEQQQGDKQSECDASIMSCPDSEQQQGDKQSKQGTQEEQQTSSGSNSGGEGNSGSNGGGGGGNTGSDSEAKTDVRPKYEPMSDQEFQRYLKMG
jgi:hypothetical protein